MAKTFNILNDHVFVFIAVVILGAIFIGIYMSIKPEKTVPYNFTPFPQEAPTDLPDPNHQTDSCWNKLTPCDDAGNCSACSLGNYECVQVSKEQGEQKHYHFNGINVPEGNWCLPKRENKDAQCNLYSGRWLWVFDDEYCNTVTPGKSQCWKCDCLYPSLFADSSKGCATPINCQNYAISGNYSQPQNKLVSTSCAPSSIPKGTPWDPTSGTLNSDVLTYQPYDQDKYGNPLFSCSCNDTSTPNFYEKLPGDPYSCHLNPCSKSEQSTIEGGLECTGNTCNPEECTCNCLQTNVAKSPSGKYAGTCVPIVVACAVGGLSSGYDRDAQACICPSPYWEQKCKSSTTGVNMNFPDLPDCITPANALGSQCINPCSAGCNNGAECVSCGPDSWKTNAVCAQGDNMNTIHSKCDCSTATEKPGKPYSGYSGPTCDSPCLASGANIRCHAGAKHKDCWSCGCCCSQRSKKVNDTIGVTYKEVCDGDWPTLDKPADKDCTTCIAHKETNCSITGC